MIVLIVHMKVRPGTEDECKGYIRAMEQHTRTEPGCIQYVGHQSLEDSTRFSFYETYKTRADLDSHWASEHFKKYVTQGLDKIVIERTKELSVPVSE
jgi:(4S)-4-hydroxy-5-phosphonooxypentane-2,3-dione isomerase